MTNIQSPYTGINENNWLDITQKLISEHPLKSNDIISCVLNSWNEILSSKIGSAQIGKDIFPQPQVIGNFLHELIPLNLAKMFPKQWRRNATNEEKDAVYILDNKYSFEIKTSSNKNKIFGNRSYAQIGSGNKNKSGYYLTVNFEKISPNNTNPRILIIRFGWIESNDWIGQAAATGQQAHLPPEIYDKKLISIYKVE